jgi:hypothetical protein
MSVTGFYLHGAEWILRGLIVPQSKNPRHIVTPTDLWLGTILSQMNPAHSFPCHLRSTLILSHLRLRLPSGLFPSGFVTITLYPRFFLSHTGYMHHLISSHLIRDLIIQTIFGDKYESWSSFIVKFPSLRCCLLRLRPKYRPQHPILEHL